MLWIPLLLILVACGGIVYYGHQVARTLEQSVAASARAGGRATAHEIAGFINREHDRLHAFVDEKQAEIRQVLAHPDDWQAIDALRASLKRMFPETIAFTVTDADGSPLFEDFDGLVGAVCESAMRTFAQTIDFDGEGFEIPPIHPIPGAYHLDLMTALRFDGGQSGLFFVSVSPSRIAEILASAEKASGTRILLVKRDDPDLIEVTASGARDVLKDGFRLAPEALVPGYFSTDLPGTHWRLLVLPDGEGLADAVRGVYVKVAVLVLALLVISAALLLAIRRYEQRNSTLFTRSLQASVGRQRAILQSMVDGMVTIDAGGTIHNVNNAVTRLFGYQQKELIGSNVSVLMPEPDRSAHDGYLRNYLTTGESKILGNGREVTARRKDGSLFPVLLTLGESVEGDEHIFVGILHDRSANKEAQRKIEAQAIAIERSNQELEEISQIAAKDLQAPLQQIASLGEELGVRHMAALSSIEQTQIRSLAAKARDMSELVKGLADYAHVEREPVDSRVDLDAILGDVQRDLATVIAATDARITVQALGCVLGNAKQLRQVFWNLLDNALKFREPGSPPDISVSLAASGDESADSAVAVLVRDNGIGIPEDQQEAVFDAFHRLHPRDAYPGMGLGLSFCRKIVEGLHGQISVSSTPGEGSTFRVTLPRAG